ncbi:monocarboxylate transporter 3 [Helicoverpa armigera]|uniref:monocarboxylate transporter 3 n=1 Tax=Helicoverpa armigera TaxID=29058 RepID=UPI0030837B49
MKMKQRVATDEQPFKTGSTDDSSPSIEEPAAALVVPPDGGWGWVVMIASFCCNFMVDGVILSGGALLPSIRAEFNATESQVAPIVSLLAGFYLLLGPIASALANKYGFRKVSISGSVIAFIGFAISYYATSPLYLYITYGLIGGFGVCLIFMPAVLTVGFYFEKWRALATGIALCGSGVGTFVMSPITAILINKFGWRVTILFQAGMMLSCIIFGSTFRPIKPITVVVEEESSGDKEDERRAEVEKVKDMMKLQGRLDAGIRMPHDMKFATRATPHTWMGVPNNTRYPTAEEVFRGSTTVINAQRRSSATASAIKTNLGAKPAYATVSEKDEQEDSSTTPEKQAKQPLIGSVLRVISQQDYHSQRRQSSTVDLAARPLNREDIFFGASLARLPQYTSRTSLGYHLAVTHIPPPEDPKDSKGRCRMCPVAVRRALATLLDFSLFKSLTFNILAISGFFTMLGFFVPFMYVQNRAYKSGAMENDLIDWLVASIGIANIIGRVLCGLVSSMPKVSPLLVTNIALTVGGISTMMSNISFSPYYQFLYCVLFGFSVACFAALRSIVVVEYLGLERLTNCYGLFLLFQGIGALIGAPIAGMLYDATESYDVSFYVSGGFILLSAVMCYPIRRINNWEKNRAEAKTKASLSTSDSPLSLVNKV